MSRLLWLLALAALAVGLSLAARFNDGYLLLVLPPYRAEISLNLTIILLLLAFVLFYACLRVVVLTISLPQRARRFRARRRGEKAAEAFRDALRLELRAQQGCGNWPEVLRLTRLLEERAGLAPELVEEIRRQAHRENIRCRQSDLGQLLDYLQQLPASENSPDLARMMAEALLVHAAHEPARCLIEAQLDRQWDSALLGFYGQLPGTDLVAAIARAEAWLPEHSADPHLLLALGRLCRKQRLWGKAQHYLEASLSLAERRETRLELARLFEQTARPDEALPHYRAAAEPPA